ncbi:nitrate/nitrite two-component system sensor histidine kinase NarQ [Photobacterium leiognathi]|uniref:nitrate/nitrite two-component system sensor histidine kinase NarQ n=1 Tax=Photobacterium leiognathi TaxID=553611 RepID=UPI002980C4F1|nr:nitrate/nitrite two-component system sensor histidine kinase NarQ [Photobacterium leiognathi]
MAKKKTNSVTSTIARSMVLILFISISTTSLALMTLTSSLNDAEAINIAGSMRMQSYRLAFDVETHSPLLSEHIEQFEQSLHSSSMKELNHWFVPNDIQQQYNHLVLRWDELHPILETEDNKSFIQHVAPFVHRVDKFVAELQESSEIKLQRLATIGTMGLTTILLIVFYTIRYTRLQIVAPLNDLVNACKQVKRKNFQFRVCNDSKNELGILAQTFSKMSCELEQLYDGLERSVTEKTRRLRHANESLQVLYNCSQQLSVSRLTTEQFTNMLETMIAIDGLTGARLIIEETTGSTTEIHVGNRLDKNWHSNDLYIDGELMGKLWWQYTLPCPDQALIDNISQILARGIYYNRAQKQAEHLLLMEERATIARELHDSLAQSLSYLKIQLTILKRELNQIEHGDNINHTVQDIEQGLSSAYTQLRELLSTFRLTIKDANFGEALNQMLEPLEEQTDALLVIDNHLPSMALDAHNQVHLLQIIREAVLNAIKHADADEITVTCYQTAQNVHVAIGDDGKGFDPTASKRDHYGLSIMQERTSRLNGELQIDSHPHQGSTISLIFPLQKG